MFVVVAWAFVVGGLIMGFIFLWGVKDFWSPSYEGASWFGVGWLKAAASPRRTKTE